MQGTFGTIQGTFGSNVGSESPVVTKLSIRADEINRRGAIWLREPPPPPPTPTHTQDQIHESRRASQTYITTYSRSRFSQNK
jgi:hypothetical protein